MERERIQAEEGGQSINKEEGFGIGLATGRRAHRGRVGGERGEGEFKRRRGTK